MINIFDVFVSTIGSLIQLVSIHIFSENIQHSMLSHLDYNNISGDTYKSEILLTFC